MGRNGQPTSCSAKPALADRRLVNDAQANDLAQLFKIFANDTRLRLLHAIVRATELSVTDLADTVGMKPQAVSNQLQRLATQGVLGRRRDGIQIFYRLVDPCVAQLLDRGLCLVEDAKTRIERSASGREPHRRSIDKEAGKTTM